MDVCTGRDIREEEVREGDSESVSHGVNEDVGDDKVESVPSNH